MGAVIGPIPQWARFLGRQRAAPDPGRRLAFDRDPAAIYAIGDVHGCLDLLRHLEARIFADAANIAGDIWLVLLGDLIDRGPASAQVIDHVLRPLPPPFTRYVLMGNHEDMLLAFLARPFADALWLANGGFETLRSYGVPDDRLPFRSRDFRPADSLDSTLPAEHIEFLANLPVAIETPRYFFVHAGVRPGVPLASQSRDDLLWFRDDYRSDYAEFGKTIVHGHTPLPEPLLRPHRIALDTGACFSGRLSAARLVAGAAPVLITADRGEGNG